MGLHQKEIQCRQKNVQHRTENQERFFILIVHEMTRNKRTSDGRDGFPQSQFTQRQNITCELIKHVTHNGNLHIEPKNQTKPETEIIAKNSVGERSVFDENGLIESHKKDL